MSIHDNQAKNQEKQTKRWRPRDKEKCSKQVIQSKPFFSVEQTDGRVPNSELGVELVDPLDHIEPVKNSVRSKAPIIFSLNPGPAYFLSWYDSSYVKIGIP